MIVAKKEEIRCPICNSRNYKYQLYKEEFWGAMIEVEQHGWCKDCGYWIEQCYSPVYEGFADCKRGWQDSEGKYHSKNVKKHKRNRRKNLDAVKEIRKFYKTEHLSNVI